MSLTNQNSRMMNGFGQSQFEHLKKIAFHYKILLNYDVVDLKLFKLDKKFRYVIVDNKISEEVSEINKLIIIVYKLQ